MVAYIPEPSRRPLPVLVCQKKFGFREIGHREKIAALKGIWRDTVLLERRSKKIGVKKMAGIEK